MTGRWVARCACGAVASIASANEWMCSACGLTIDRPRPSDGYVEKHPPAHIERPPVEEDAERLARVVARLFGLTMPVALMVIDLADHPLRATGLEDDEDVAAGFEVVHHGFARTELHEERGVMLHATPMGVTAVRLAHLVTESESVRHPMFVAGSSGPVGLVRGPLSERVDRMAVEDAELGGGNAWRAYEAGDGAKLDPPALDLVRQIYLRKVREICAARGGK